MNREMIHAVEGLPNRRRVILDELGNVHRAPCPHDIKARAVVTTVVAGLAFGRAPCECLRVVRTHKIGTN